MSNSAKAAYDAGDRVALVKDRGMLKKGAVGTVTKHNTIRGDLATEMQNNVTHGSDSPQSAAREVALFFPGLA